MPKFDDPRLVKLNSESGFRDGGMRRALANALEFDEVAVASYSVSAHIWVEAVLTDRALLLVKGAVRARVHRMTPPLDVTRVPAGTRKGARLRTPLGEKTLWGSMRDPDLSLLMSGSGTATAADRPESLSPVTTTASATPSGRSPTAPTASTPARRTRRERAAARKHAGRKPRKPRRQRARPAWTGFPPSSTIWDVSYHCIKCGRALTNPNSQRHRVGTDCIKRYGSQARKVANPAYTQWSARKAKAEVDRIAQQVTYDAEFARATATYDAALQRWREIRSGSVTADRAVNAGRQ